MNLRIAMCDALVDGWHGGWKMSRVITHAWRLTDKTPDNEVDKYLLAAEAVKVKRLWSEDTAQTWIARNMVGLNDALWAGRKRDTCIAMAKKALGLNVGIALRINVRDRDKRADWGTVK